MKPYPIFGALLHSILSIWAIPAPVLGQYSCTSTQTTTAPPELVTTRFHVVERLNVYTPRNIDDVKQRIREQLGNLTSPVLLTAGTDSRENYTATVNRYKGPSGYILFQTIFHGRWFRLWGFADPNVYVPQQMTQYTLGDPLALLSTARYTLDAFLDAPIRLLVVDTANGGTNIMWERPCTLSTFPLTPFIARQTCKELDTQV
ncbi:hypothetical protein TWF730_010624 [Orbilia blumenaviensis]|uniref:Uncharacterized protein n=1 Tax=Orbilia blumenaviensis TaxID=1796055 RepID=A0AAV9UPR2_9PEZI